MKKIINLAERSPQWMKALRTSAACIAFLTRENLDAENLFKLPRLRVGMLTTIRLTQETESRQDPTNFTHQPPNLVVVC